MSSQARNTWLPSSVLGIRLSKRKRRLLQGILGSVGIVVFWELASGEPLHLVTELMLPPPSLIYENYMKNQTLLHRHLWSTMSTAGIGWIIAVTGGTLMALLLSHSERMEDTLMPIMISGNSIPRVTLAPVFLFYIGGFSAKYIISAWVAFFPMFINAFDGVEDISPEQKSLLESFGASRLQEYRYVRIMNAIPFIFDGMKIAVTMSVVGAVVGEFVGASEGVGFIALQSLRVYNIGLMFSVIALASFVTVFAFFIVFKIQDMMIYWKETSLLS
ncbi:MAG: ABC transporter permease [Halobacteriota archaeon]